MPRISDSLLDICVYLYPSGLDGDNGFKAGGSGFLVSIPFKNRPERCFNYAVTNRHVIEKGNTAVRFNTGEQTTETIDFMKADWLFHPAGDDLAICKMPSLDAKNYKYRMLRETDHFLTERLVGDLNIGPGDDVFVVGRFINQDGRHLNAPSVRFGNLAQMPPMAIKQDRSSGSFDQESFIVEARSIGGYSGSPVFVAMDPNYPRLERAGVVENRTILLGVCWGYINDWAPVYDDAGEPVLGMKVKSSTGMMGVVPAWKLAELLRLPEIKAIQAAGDQEAIRELARTQGGLTAGISLTSPTADLPEK